MARIEVAPEVLVDFDRFGTINDTLGYVTADQLLREVAKRIVACVRESDTVARFGGDDFALLLTDVNRPEDAAKIARKVCDAIHGKEGVAAFNPHGFFCERIQLRDVFNPARIRHGRAQ